MHLNVFIVEQNEKNYSWHKLTFFETHDCTNSKQILRVMKTILLLFSWPSIP